MQQKQRSGQAHCCMHTLLPEVWYECLDLWRLLKGAQHSAPFQGLLLHVLFLYSIRGQFYGKGWVVP